jgi:hypothetical protein
MYIQRKRWRLNRRTFLRAAGVSLALPWLEAMGLRSHEVANAGSLTDAEMPRRAYFSNWGFFEVGAGIPSDTGLNYTLTPTLEAMRPHKSEFTLLSGMRTFTGGHGAMPCLLTGMNSKENGFKLVSVDQQIAEFYRGQTRVPSLVLSIDRQPMLSWSRNQTPIAPENSPRAVFDRLFRVEDAQAVAANRNRMDDESSILDRVRDQARQLERQLGRDDRATLEQYLNSVREVEERIQIDRAWLNRPKPRVEPMDFGAEPSERQAMLNDDGTGMRRYLRLMFDVIVLAFQTDSTRVVSHFPKGQDGPVFRDRTRIPHDYHALTHHGYQEDKLRWWAQVDGMYVDFWAYFIGKLKSVREGNATLLDRTMAAWATTNGVGGHGRDNLPVMLCGGSSLGIRHQGHVVKRNVMVGNVWQTMVDRLGMPIPRNFQGGQANGLVGEVL